MEIPTTTTSMLQMFYKQPIGSSLRQGWRTGCLTWRYSPCWCQPSSMTTITQERPTTSTFSQHQIWLWSIMTSLFLRIIMLQLSLGKDWLFKYTYVNNSKAFRVMIDNECNILSNLSKFEFQQLRTLMIEMILSTGKRRKRLVSHVKEKIRNNLAPFLQTCPHTSHN